MVHGIMVIALPIHIHNFFIEGLPSDIFSVTLKRRDVQKPKLGYKQLDFEKQVRDMCAHVGL